MCNKYPLCRHNYSYPRTEPPARTLPLENGHYFIEPYILNDGVLEIANDAQVGDEPYVAKKGYVPLITQMWQIRNLYPYSTYAIRSSYPDSQGKYFSLSNHYLPDDEVDIIDTNYRPSLAPYDIYDQWLLKPIDRDHDTGFYGIANVSIRLLMFLRVASDLRTVYLKRTSDNEDIYIWWRFRKIPATNEI